jgi:hypothetical protein
MLLLELCYGNQYLVAVMLTSSYMNLLFTERQLPLVIIVGHLVDVFSTMGVGRGLKYQIQKGAVKPVIYSPNFERPCIFVSPWSLIWQPCSVSVTCRIPLESCFVTTAMKYSVVITPGVLSESED